jgi:Retrotransposon gag protein/Retroviral aspartyl protease/Zinc knuckle
MQSSRASSRSRTGPGLARSPVFATLDRKLLWIQRTRDESLTDFDKAALVGEIIAMTDEAVSAALASFRLKEEDVEDSPSPPPAPAPPAPGPRPVTVEDVGSNDPSDRNVSDDDEDPTDRYNTIPLPPSPPPAPRRQPPRETPKDDIPVHPYVPQRRARYEEPDPSREFRRTEPIFAPRTSFTPHPGEFMREMTTESMRARRAPVPTIESQTKPPNKFKGEEMSFIKVDVFLKKMERYLRAGHGLDLSVDDIGDYIFDALDDYAYRWFHTLHKPSPYLFAQFDKDLRKRYVPINYKDQLADEYDAVRQGNDRLFTDYLTELHDYEDMLGDVTLRDKYRVLKRGINDDLRKSMVVFEGVPYDDFVDHATRIDPALFKKRQEKEPKEKKSASSSSTVSHGNKATTSQSTSSSTDNRRRFRPTSASKRSSPARKPVIKELRPEISRAECDKRGLCRHCKKPGHIRRDCSELQKAQQAQQPLANAVTIALAYDTFGQAPVPTVNKVHRGYAVKDTRSYRDAALGKPKLEAPSWSVDKRKLGESSEVKNISNGTGDPAPSEEPLPRLEEPLIARIRINGVEARCLVDTGASGDFVSSQFTYVNRLKHRKLKEPVPIQQAVKGSKPKCNAIATATLHIGDWSKKTPMYVIHLANYDAIIGLPTLMDCGAQFDLTNNTLQLRQYDVSLPLERSQPRPSPAQRPSRAASTRLRRQAPNGTAGQAPVRKDRHEPAPVFELAAFPILLDDMEEVISADPPTFSHYPEIDKNGTADYYRDIIYEKYGDVFVDKLPAQLPPLRCVNHRIPVTIEEP